MGKKDWIDAIFCLYDSDPIFQEALSLSSTSLYGLASRGALKRNSANAAKLLRYALRMSSRSIPFGLFSFVSIGHWSDRTEVMIRSSNIQKHARPDMSWIYAFIQKIYKDFHRFSQLFLYTNPLIYENKGRFSLSYIRGEEREKKLEQKVASIHVTPITKAIFAFAKKGIAVFELCDELKSFVSEYHPGKMQDLLKSLFSQQFLLPFLPSLLHLNPLESLITHPESAPLRDILSDLRSYQKSRYEEGKEHLFRIEKKMKEIASAEKYIQVDAVYRGSSLKITKQVAQEAAKAASFLWRISSKNHNGNKLRKYREKFLERYGTARSVPLLEMLCPNKGLGHFKDSALSLNTSFQNNLEKWLKLQSNKIQGEDRPEIILTDEIIDEIEKESAYRAPSPFEAQLSTDLFCEIIASTQRDMDEGNFVLIPTHPSWHGGGSLGRFMYLFDEGTRLEIQDYFAKEEKLDPDALFIETSCWPITGNQANVSNHLCMRQRKLDLSERESMSLEDIYVSADIDRFHITLKGGEAINACCGNLLIADFLPSPIQFIRAVTLANRRVIEPRFWGCFEEGSEFLPRIRYGKSILYPAVWMPDRLLFLNKGQKEIIEGFINWAQRLKLPKKCFEVFGDQRLLIDWSHPACIEEIAKKLRKGQLLKFVEYIPTSWCEGSEGVRLCEVVVPLLKNPAYTERRKKSHPSYLPVAHRERVKFLGSEWISVKFYFSEAEVDHFLVQEFFPFCELIEKEESIAGWFFVRYHDPDFHLRLRLRLRSKESFAIIVQRIEQQAMKWSECGMLNRCEFSTYEREVERYGGTELMEVAEALFCADSCAMIPQIRDLTEEKEFCPRRVYLVLSVLAFLDGFGLSDEQKSTLLKIEEAHYHFLSGYREHKLMLKEGLQALREGKEENIPRSICSSSMRRKPLQDILREYFNSQSVPSSCSIYSSFLHMHCNRLGCSREEEMGVLSFAYQTIKHRMNNLQQKVLC